MKFKIGDIVSHSYSYNKFYVIIDDYKNGQYEVEDCDSKERKVLMGKYFLTKSDRRNYVIDDLLDDKSNFLLK